MAAWHVFIVMRGISPSFACRVAAHILRLLRARVRGLRE